MKLRWSVIIFWVGLTMSYSQTFFKDNYISHHTFSFFKSTVVSLVNNGTTSFITSSDNGFSIQSKHGLIFLKRFSFQIGTGIEYSLSINNMVVPLLLDAKIYAYKYAEASPYVMIGKCNSIYYNNFRLDETYIGIGFSFEAYDNFEIIVELIKRIRDLDQNLYHIYMNNESYGLTIGLKM